MRVLFIACYSPLINNSAAIETLQYLNNLALEGNEVELLTVDFPEDCIYYDGNLLRLINQNIKIHKVDGGGVFNSLIPRRKSGEGSENKNTNTSALRKMLRKVKNAVIIPDMYSNWAKNAGEYGIKLMEERKFDVIFSMHEPPSSHLCALYIKERYKDIPWVTYWSDPWLKDSTRESAFFVKKNIEKKMEKKIVRNSNAFIFVTEKNREDYMETYNLDKDKTFIVTRGYNGKLYEELSKEYPPKLIRSDKLNLVYAGEIFSKLRDIRPFIEALGKLEKENKNFFNKLNILFFGNIDDNVGKEKLKSFSNVKVSGRIPFNEALKYTLFSEGLLLFGNKNSKQIPAKIYDYFGASGKILTIYGDNNDPLIGVVGESEKSINVSNSSEEIKGALEKMVELYENKEILTSPNSSYEWSNISKKLNKIINEV